MPRISSNSWTVTSPSSRLAGSSTMNNAFLPVRSGRDPASALAMWPPLPVAPPEPLIAPPLPVWPPDDVVVPPEPLAIPPLPLLPAVPLLPPVPPPLLPAVPLPPAPPPLEPPVPSCAVPCTQPTTVKASAIASPTPRAVRLLLFMQDTIPVGDGRTPMSAAAPDGSPRARRRDGPQTRGALHVKVEVVAGVAEADVCTSLPTSRGRSGSSPRSTSRAQQVAEHAAEVLVP